MGKNIELEKKYNENEGLLNKLKELSILQFISWLENRAKINIDQELWNKMKQNINYYL